MSGQLTEFDVINGSFTLLFVLISIIVGVRILLKYFSLRRKDLITVGLTWIFLSSGWWGAGFSFLSYVLFGILLDQVIYLFISNAFVAIALICWMYSFANFVYGEAKGKKIFGIFFIICLAYEIVLISLFIINPKILGTFYGVFYYQGNILILVFQIFAILLALITGIIFSRKSMQSEDKKLRLKGKFLLIAFISFTIGAIIDATLATDPVTLIIARLILASSAIEYYLGFLLPDKLAQKIIK